MLRVASSVAWVRLGGVVILAIAALAAYDVGVRRLRARGVTWPATRRLAFTIGVIILAAASSGPVPDRFSGRVVEHVLVGMVGPWSMVLGRPITLAVRAGGRARSTARWALHARVPSRLAHPLVALALFALGPWVLWLTPLYRWEGRSELVHSAVHLHLVLSGALFAVAVLGLEPTAWRHAHPLRLLSAALLLPVHTVLGLVLLSARQPYLQPHLPAEAALADQRLGAALLWVIGDGLATTTLLLIGWQWAAADRRDPAPSATPVVGTGVARGGRAPRLPGG